MITKLEIIRKSQGYTQIELGKKIGFQSMSAVLLLG